MTDGQTRDRVPAWTGRAAARKATRPPRRRTWFRRYVVACCALLVLSAGTCALVYRHLNLNSGTVAASTAAASPTDPPASAEG
ncbi:hypothetical protein [Streptomyces fractus]|uniref:hypothetical protein n=1 Tax=Streptomyces fractus TaxID=641806 RepID=UPI003CF2234C